MNSSFTKFFAILVCIYVLFALHSNGQAGIGLPYGFGVVSTATNITGATTINLTIRPAAIQDEMDTLINIPSAGAITFGGIVYNQFVVSTNGWLALTPSSAGLPASNPLPPNPNNSLSTSSIGYPVIAPLWDDMAMASIQYNWTAPVLTVKWTGRWDKTNASFTNAFGVKIDGTTGICTFFYNNVAYTPTSPSASIGIAGVCTGDFTSVNVLSATTAASDSVTEWNVTTRPNNVNYIFTPYNPHNNCSGTYIAKNLGTIGSSCTLSGNYSTVQATTSGSGMACAAGEVKDVWFSVIKPLGVTNVRVTTAPGTCQVLGGTTVEVRASCAGASLGCSTTGSTYPTFGEVDIARPCAAETLYVRVTGDADAAGKFRICVMDNGSGVLGGNTCNSPTYICSLPYNQTGLTTLGAGNDYDSTNTVCHSLYARGEDYIFAYTPTVSQCVSIAVTSTGTNPGVFIYNNCPDSSGTGPTYCLGSAEGVTGTVTINSVTLLAGTTYYIMVDNQIAGGNIPFDISVTSLGTANTYDNCATPISLGSIGSNVTCSYATFTTECSTPSAAGLVPIPTCINTSTVPRTFIDGITGDVWLSFTSAFSTAGVLNISTQKAALNSTANAAMAVYTGTCGALTQYACDYNSGLNGMPFLSIPITTTPTTYFIRIWSENPESQGSFDICLQSNSSLPNTYAIGDFGSIASGNYNASTTWGIWNGAAWTAVPAGSTPGINYPDRTTNVFILGGKTVVMNVSNLQCKTLTVDLGGKIWGNSAGNLYLNIHGDIVCNGIIGNGTTFDGLSLGIESATCTVTGTGSFDVSRIRKNTNYNPATVFNINRNINIRFNSSSQVQIFNNNASGTTRFDVYIAAGCTLNLTASGALTGNAAIDGDIVSGGTVQSSGSFTINGMMIVSGTTYLVTNNTSSLIAGFSTVAGSTTVTGPTGALTIGTTVIGNGTLAGAFPNGTIVTSIINATTLTVSAGALITGTGSILQGGACSWTINSGGVLKTSQVSTAYATFSATTVAASVFVNTASTANLTVGSGIVGNGIPVGATIVAIISGTQFQISSGATSAGTNTMNISGGSAGHLLRVMPGGTFEITGSSGFNTALPTTNYTWDFQNGSYTEYSAQGNQNIPLIPASTSIAYGLSSNAYGNLKISGAGTRTMFTKGFYNISNDLNIVNSNGSPVLSCDTQTIRMLGGNWYNYNQSGFNEVLGTVVFNGTNTQTINTVGGERFYRLTFSKLLSSTLQFNCPVNCINWLTWTTNGPVFLNSNRLTIENPASTAINNSSNPLRYIISETVNSSSFVQWNIGTVSSASTYTFPFGKPGVPDYIPFTYSVIGATTVGNLSVSTYGTQVDNLPWPISPYVVNNLNSSTGLLPDNSPATVDRFWSIQSTAFPLPSATVTLRYTSNELPLSPFNIESLMNGQWYDPNINKWTPPQSGQITGAYFVTIPSFNKYGVWTLSSTNSPLEQKLVASIVSTVIVCNGDSSMVTITASGGTPPYSGTGIFYASAGTHSYTVSDSYGFSVTTSIVITEPDQLVAMYSANTIQCTGGLASANISASGGSAPYTGTGSFTAGAGTYSYIVSDANGCSDTIDVIISEPTQLVASATSSPILCVGENSNIIVTATGGTTPYSGTGSYTVGAGTYSYIVNDVNSCADTIQVAIGQPSPLLISINASPIICSGDSSTVVVSASGGTEPYLGVGVFKFAQGVHNITVTDANGCVTDTTISISGSSLLTVTINQASQILCNGGSANVNVTASGGTGPYTGTGIFSVAAGSHTFTVTDFNGCVATGSITITQPNAFMATATLITPILCKGGSATISITTTGGASNYAAIFNATAGVQNYTIIDANGCPSTASITLTEPDSLQPTVSYLPLICFGGTTSVLVSAIGGTSPYNGTGSFNVGVGTYTFLVSDANGCEVSKTITIAEPQQIIVNASPGTINCFGGTTTVMVSATGGLSPYSGIGNFTANAGINNFTVTDANGCTSSTSVELLSPSQLIASSIQTSTITCSGGLANILVSATGGIGPYSGTGTFSAVAGTHVYNISDANGCAASTEIVIGQPSLFVATASITTPIQCYGGSAIVTVTTTGGTSNYSASYTVTAGSHNYTIIDANGCSSTASITVTQPDSLKMLSSYLPINCYGGSTSVNISATGGIVPYTGVGNFTVAAGTQTFTVSDANGCVVSNSLSLTQPSQLIVNVIAGTINCNGGVTTVSVSASGGTPGYTGVGTFTVGAGTHNYVVTDANGCSANATAEVTQSGIPVSVSVLETTPISCNGDLATISVSASGGAGTYTGTGTFIVSAGTHSYTVTDSNGCTGSGAIAITEPSLLSINSTTVPIQCYGGLGSISITAIGGTGPYVGVGTFSVFSGEHTFVVTDANNCSSSVTTTLNQPAKVEGSITTTSSGCSGITGTATVFPTGGVGPYSYLWSDGQSNSNAIGLQAGPYSVIITDANNCTGSVSTTIINEGTLPPAPSTISGPTSLCRNSIGVVFTIAPVVGANSYVWILPNGVSGSSTTNSITISTSSTYVGGFICVSAVNACGIGSASCKNVPVITTYPSRPTIIVGSAVTCGPSIFTYSTTGNNASSFTWSITGTGATILSGQGSNTIQVSIPTGFTQGSIQVYATNCYGNSSSRGMTITGIPVHSNSVTGPSFICANNSATYTMPLVTGVAPLNYIWSVTGDAVVTSSTVSAVASIATINFGSNWTSGIVTISVLNSCGSHARSFTVRSVPTQPGSITGPNTGLCNLTGVSYSVGTVANATSYTWSVPPGATITSTSLNGQSIVVDFSPAFTSNSANICVTANNGCGVGTSRCYVVTSRLAAPLITGPTSVCQSQSNVVYSIVPMAGALSYAWTASDNGIITPSSNSANVNFNLVTNSTSTIRANVFNACGASPLGSTIVSVNNTCREIGESQFNDQQIKFSPNPVSEKGMIGINSIINQKCIIRITDILGNDLSYELLYLIKGVNSEEIDFSNYPSGVYFLKVLTEDETMKTIKVVVQ